MIKQGIKNFFVNLKYFFMPLGSMFLGIIIGISFLVPGIIQALSNMIDEVEVLGDNLNLDFNALWDMIWDEIISLNWEEPKEALEVLFSNSWLNNLLTNALNTILGTDFEAFEIQIVDIINSFVQNIQASFVIFFIWWLMGFLFGYILLRFLVRRNIARRNLWQFVLNIFVDSILSALFIITSTILYSLWSPSIFISVALTLLCVGFFSLVGAYIIFGRKKVPFKNVVNFKNIGAYYLANICVMGIAIAITLCALFMNLLFGIFVGLSILAIAFLVTNMNAESYVLSLVKQEKQ